MIKFLGDRMMAKNQNGNQPDPKENRRLIKEFKVKRVEANKEVERAEQAVRDYQQPRIQEAINQAPGSTSRGEIAISLDVNRTHQDLLDKRQEAIAARHDWDVRIGKLRKVLGMLGES
jgi:hypothetical protein